MKNFKAFLKQKYEGCDYTIGCGIQLIDIKAENIEEAKNILGELLREEYKGESEIEECELYECVDTVKIDTRQIYDRIKEEEKELKKQDNIKQLEKEILRLKNQ